MNCDHSGRICRQSSTFFNLSSTNRLHCGA